MAAFMSLLEESVSEGRKGILSAVVVGFGRAGSDAKIFFEKGAGKSTWGSETPAGIDSTFWAFSCTKLLTTIAALQAVERGLVSLDTEVSSILPELSECQIISAGAEDGSFKLEPASGKITLRQLLSHTSGINYDAMDPLTIAWRKSRGEAPMVFSGKVKEAFSTPLLFEPGEGWVYGGSIDWAGILVERLNKGVKLGEYTEENIFKPLHMKASTFALHTRPDIEENLLQMNNRGSDGVLTPVDSPYKASDAEHSGGTGLVMSVADFASVLMDLLKDEPVLLKATTVEGMFQPQFSLGSPQHKGLLAQEFLYKPLTGHTSGEAPVSFGLGGLVTVEDVPNLPKNSLTWNGMPNIGWYLNREKGLGGLFVTQVLPAGDPICVKLIGQLEQDAWNYAAANGGGT